MNQPTSFEMILNAKSDSKVKMTVERAINLIQYNGVARPQGISRPRWLGICTYYGKHIAK